MMYKVIRRLSHPCLSRSTRSRLEFRSFSTVFAPSILYQEYAIIHPNVKPETKECLNLLKSDYRHHLKIIESNDNRLNHNSIYWYLANDRYILDSSYFSIVSNNDSKMITEQWNNAIQHRIDQKEFSLTYQDNSTCSRPSTCTSTSFSSCSAPECGETRNNDKSTTNNNNGTNGKNPKSVEIDDKSEKTSNPSNNYLAELNLVVSVVSKGCYYSRSEQNLLYQQVNQLQNYNKAIKKMDKTPITALDFVMQILIIDHIHRHFPNDKFIAEEDSAMLQADDSLCYQVLAGIQAITNDTTSWTKEKLFYTLDLGGYTGDNIQNERVWALDPIDGTKGFIKGLHYCISIILLDKGIPQLSITGCPNLNLYNVLENPHKSTVIDIGENVTIDSKTSPTIATHAIAAASSSAPILLPPFPIFDNGSVFYSVTGKGAYARALTMPLDQSVRVRVSDNCKLNESTLVEATETQKHDHHLTRNVANIVRMTSDYIRLHSQVKYMIVGAGAADATIRFPPRAYVEKVWDHAPGAHFVKEAGGKVTDLNGLEIEWNLGRDLHENVRGIVASNGKIHSKLLYAIQTALQP
jgi:3'-phosphoadenosine 5'-phosphosulfate (PAPS) 3'-phosphatase